MDGDVFWGEGACVADDASYEGEVVLLVEEWDEAAKGDVAAFHVDELIDGVATEVGEPAALLNADEDGSVHQREAFGDSAECCIEFFLTRCF